MQEKNDEDDIGLKFCNIKLNLEQTNNYILHVILQNLCAQ